MEKRTVLTDISPMAQKWLAAHGYARKAENVKEYARRLEFTVKTDKSDFVTLHTIFLPNGSWETHEIHRRAVKENW